MNCQTFSTGLSSGHFGGRAMMVMLAARRGPPPGAGRVFDHQDGGGGPDHPGDPGEAAGFARRSGLERGRARAASLNLNRWR